MLRPGPSTSHRRWLLECARGQAFRSGRHDRRTGRTDHELLELADDGRLDHPATGLAEPKAASDYRIVGTSVPRVDLPDKLAPRPRFVHDMALDGMLYGRVIRPPSRGAILLDIGTEPVLALPGVVIIVRDGSFLGVIAEREEVALRAADLLRGDAKWQEQPTLPDEDNLPAFLTSAPAETAVLAESAVGAGSAPPAGGSARPAARSHEATYHRPYLAHAAMGPSSATALATVPPGNGAKGSSVQLEVWTHSQGVYLLRRALARALKLTEEQVCVRHVEGAGCYGHNGADDAAMDAALLALAVPGRPVQVVWSRSDELGWAPYGPAVVVRIAADVDARGDVLSWQHEIWGNGQSPGPGSPRPGCSRQATGTAASRSGRRGTRRSAGGRVRADAVPGYAFPAYRAGVTGCRSCRCGPPRCARSAASSTCSRSSHSWTNSHGPGPGPRYGRIPARPAGGPPRPGGDRGRRPAVGLGRLVRVRVRIGRPWHPLSPLQEQQCLLRGGRRGGGRHRGAGAPADHRRQRRPGDQPRRRREPGRGRRDPGDQLDAEGTRAVQQPYRYQRHLGQLSDSALL